MMTKVIEETVAITFDSDCGIEVIPSWCFDYGIQKNFNQSKALDTIFNALSMDGKFTVSNANLRDFLKLVEPYCSEPQPYTIFDTYEEADEYLEDLLGDEQ
jgi:hypothetical protein